jgi:hypothetical protein
METIVDGQMIRPPLRGQKHGNKVFEKEKLNKSVAVRVISSSTAADVTMAQTLPQTSSKPRLNPV